MKPTVPMREALDDPHLLGLAIPGPTWALWRTLLIASMGESLTDDERELFASVTGRELEPAAPVDEFWNVAGRRSGKTRAAATMGVYLAALCDWSDYLATGERGVLPVLAETTYQAGRAFQHIEGIITHSEMLATLIESPPTSDTISLSTRVDIVITPASFRTVRSITAVGAIADEVAFWAVEGTKNPDREILNALRPALATTRAPLIVISSPYARRGELYRTWKSDYGPDGDPSILVVKAASRTFNPTLPREVIDKAYRRDASAARAEYGGEFRVDVETLLSREIVEGAVDANAQEHGRQPGVGYFGFVDPSGGSSDSMTLAIGHKGGDRAVIDLQREKRAPFSPGAVVAEFAGLLKAYGLSAVTGDRYAGEWPREQFRAHGIEYRLSDANKSELYLGLVPALNSGRVVLLDDETMVEQLVALERRTARGGRDTVDHPVGHHDDVANAIAGVVHLTLDAGPPLMPIVGTYGPPTRRTPANPLTGAYSYA